MPMNSDKMKLQHSLNWIIIITLIGILVLAMLLLQPFSAPALSNDGIASQEVPLELQPTDPAVLDYLASKDIDKTQVEKIAGYGLAADNLSPYSETYKNHTTGEYFLFVSETPMVNVFGEEVVSQWETKDSKNFTSPANQFLATVATTKGTITVYNDQPDGKVKKDNILSFQPQLYLGAKEVKPVSTTPTLLAVDPLNENYSNNVLEWDYGICKRYLRLIEGQLQGYWVFSANPCNDVRVRYNQVGDFTLKLGSFATDADTEVFPASVFSTPQDYGFVGYPLYLRDSLTFYPDASPETSGVDGFAYETTGANWATIRAAAGDGADDSGTDATFGFRCFTVASTYDRLYRFITVFDTSSIPDTATITGATYSIFAPSVIDENAYNLYANVYTSAPASDTAVVAGDYDSLGSTVLCDTSIGDAAWDVDGYQNFTLNAAGLATISKTGKTKLGMREKTYDADGATPTWANSADGRFISYQSDKGVGYKPTLVVTYTSPAPAVVTNAAYNVEETSATLSGNLTAANGTVAYYGFQWDTDSGAPYANSSNNTGSIAVGVYSENRAGLTAGELYYYRAWAQNENGVGYGDEVTFLTKPYTPSLLGATEDGLTADLAWTKGTGAQNTIIRGKKDAYPADYADGYAVYNGAGTEAEDTAAEPGTYFYRAWSYATEGGLEQYSDDYAGASVLLGEMISKSGTILFSGAIDGSATISGKGIGTMIIVDTGGE